MDGLQHFRTLVKYNTRLNQQVLSAASSLTQEQLLQDRGAFFKSIFGTLNHILVGDIIWLRRFYLHHGPDNTVYSQLSPLNTYPAINSLDQVLFNEFDEYKTARLNVDSIIEKWINQELTEPDLESPFTYQNMKGDCTTKNFGEVLSHLFNHQTHHRGQVSTLLSQQGIDVGVTDYLVDIRSTSE